MHIDMDAFFASVEQRDNPDLRGKPVVVGSPPTQRGVVAAASYEARAFGVRSAMPSVTAGRLCPKAVFVPPRIERYRAESDEIMSILSATGGTLERVSIDEAFLDCGHIVAAAPAVPSTCSVLEKAVRVARGLKEQIQCQRHLTATVGIASNKLLAKLASDFQKPDGLTVIAEREKVAFLRPLPVRALYGVGPVTEQALRHAGIVKIADLQDYAGDLRPLVGSFATQLRQFAFGEDDRPLETEEVIKSISSEETFLKDTDDRQVLRHSLRQQAEDVATKLCRRNLAARTVQVKLRYGDFTTLTRQITVEEPLSSGSEVYRLACFLLGREKLVNRPLRLLGLGVSHLEAPQTRQLWLWKEQLTCAR
jgi:DNA polymerase IV